MILKSNLLIGGVSSIIEAILYIFGLTILFTILQPTTDETKSGLDNLKFIIDNKVIYQTWILLIYIVFGLVLVPLTISISESFKAKISIWTKATPVFGFIWAGLLIASGMIGVIGIDSVSATYNSDPNSALCSWKTIEAIQNGLGGGVEIIGGLWVFLISVINKQQAKFSKFLSYFGLLVGITGILTIFPSLKNFGAIFGLTQIVWFIWIGITMLNDGKKS